MKSSYQNLNPKAFTLLELSITIITIAILLSAILSARSLKSNLEQKAFYTEIVQIREKINNFKLIYDYLPGDFPKAGKLFNSVLSTCTDETINSGYGTSDRSGCNGDGDNNWDIALTSCCYGEGYMVWLHLQLAGLLGSPHDGDEYYFGYKHIDEPYSDGNNLYRSKIYHALFLPSESWYSYSSHVSTRYPRMKIFHGTVAQYEADAEFGLFTPSQLYKIDLKFDDGHPLLGDINARKGWYTVSTSYLCMTGDDLYTKVYDTSHNEKTCDMFYVFKD